MAGTTPMSVQDALWLTMDRPNNLMVVDGAMVLSAIPDLQDVQAVFQATVDRYPVLGRRAVRHGLGWAWEDDPSFDLSRHVTATTLEEPRDMALLQQFVADQRAEPLDKRRPLWRGFLVRPLRLDDGTEGAAIVTRFHHSIADGVRLTQLLLTMLGSEQDPGVSAVPARTRNAPVAPGGLPAAAGVALGAVRVAAGGVGAAVAGVDAIRRAVVGAAGGAVQGVVHRAGDAAQALTGAVGDPVATISAAPGAVGTLPGRTAAATAGLARAGVHGVEEGVELVRHPDRLLDALEVLGVPDQRMANDLSSVTKLAFGGSPQTVWSGTPGKAKAMAWSRPLPLDGVKAVGRAHGATVNDVMLAAVAGGLRRYLALHGGEADEVVWMIPVNLKPFEENLPTELGNYFALVFLSMPLDGADPVTRLREMHQRMERIKHSDEAVLTFGLQRLVSMSPGQMAFFLTNFFANKAVGVLTNVPGPRGPMTFAGAPVIQAVGFAPCSGDNPMTATIFSYNGEVTVGFGTDAGLVPDPDVLAALVVDELTEMQRTLRPARRRRPAAASPSRRRRRSTPGTLPEEAVD